MKTIELSKLLPHLGDAEGRRRTFAWLNLGIVESLGEGSLSPSDATQFFFNARNCRFVRDHMRDKVADEIMGRGVQLQDLFDVLPQQEARREFQSELRAMRLLCSRLLKAKSSHRTIKRVTAKSR